MRAAPDALRRDLLLAVTAPEPAAQAAWDRWQRGADLEALPPSVFALLPALARRLTAWGVEHPWMGRLRGVQRYAWTQNQLCVRDLAVLDTTFRSAGVPLMVPAGVPVIADLYGDVAGRLADHVDLLVPPDALDAAAHTLTVAGWCARTALPPVALRPLLGPVVFDRPGHRHVRLHWRSLSVPLADTADGELFGRRRDVMVAGRPIPVPDPLDLLILTCTHGRRLMPADDHRWAADALILLYRLDTDGWLAAAYDRATALGVGDAFARCIQELRAIAGADAFSTLGAVPSGAGDDPWVRALLAPDATPPSAHRGVARAWMRYRAWCVATARRPTIPGAIAFTVRLYRADWNLPLYALPGAAWRRLQG